MGQRSLSLKSPDARQKLSQSLKPNANVNASNSTSSPSSGGAAAATAATTAAAGGICMNGYYNQLGDLSDLEIDDDPECFDDDDLDDLADDAVDVDGASKLPTRRPTGMDIKHETPL